MGTLIIFLAPAIVMVGLGAIEIWTVLRSVNWYRVLGAILIALFMIVVWVLSYPLAYPLYTIILGNLIFIPVIFVYASTGFCYAVFRRAVEADDL